MTVFNLPDLGEGLPDAEINEWFVNVGDTVTTDQPLVSMETAKAIVDVPSPQDGVIKKLYGNPGDIIVTGKPLIEFESSVAKEAKAESTAKVAVEEDAGTVVGNIEQSGKTVADDAVISDDARPRATPAIRALARKMGIDLATVTPSGEFGVITKTDLQAFAPGATIDEPAQLQPGFEPVRGVRRAMARSMTQSHQEVVPVTLFDEVDIHAWKQGTDITARLIQALCHACRQEPALNAWFDTKTQSIKRFDTVHLGLAMDTADGLFVPVIKDAQTLSSKQIREQINQFKADVKAREVPADKLSGNTITLSNFGNFAGRFASPIIVPPTVAILGVGRLRQAVVADDNGEVAVHKVIPLSLSFDHRAATGGEATRFLGAMMQSLSAA